MHIVFISCSQSGAGGSEALWSQAAFLALRSGYRVSVFLSSKCKDNPLDAQLRAAGGRVSYWMMGSRIPSLPVRIFRKITRIKPHKPQFWQRALPSDADIYCVNQGGPFCATWMEDLPEALLRSRKPYVLLARGNRIAFHINDQWRALARDFIKASSLYIGASDNIVESSKRILASDFPSSVLHSPLADFEDIAKTWNDEQPLHFGCVGRLMAIEKGQDTLLAALSAPIWRDRPFKLSFYGSGPDLNYFQELARFYGLENKISFRGQMQNIQEAWREVHIAVVPSNFEGVPQAMLEAMLCARPVVATAVGGIPEWLEEGRGGFLAEAPTPRYLANALERAWENRHRWREIGEAARAACLEMLDPDPAGRLLGLLETAAAAAEN